MAESPDSRHEPATPDSEHRQSPAPAGIAESFVIAAVGAVGVVVMGVAGRVATSRPYLWLRRHSKKR